MILTAFRRGFQNRTIHALYGMIVAQARSRVFYADYGVPDTIEGRFELLVLHLVLVLNRLGQINEAGGKGHDLGQRLFDAFCRDLDDNLREMGVGDMAVPRRMRHFGEAFYGRQAAYYAALGATDQGELEKALARNIFEVAAVDERAVRLARYARAATSHLDTENDEVIATGKVVFPSLSLLHMPERESEKQIAAPWQFPVALEDLPETGKRFDLVANPAIRAAVARLAGLRDLPRLEGNFEVQRRGAGLHVTGRLSATVGQNCVVTLQPLASEVEENVDLLFAPRPAVDKAKNGDQAAGIAKEGNTEPLIDGRIDLGAIATEFLILGIDPYPRKPGAVFQPPQDPTPDEGPFAALGALKKDRDAR